MVIVAVTATVMMVVVIGRDDGDGWHGDEDADGAGSHDENGDQHDEKNAPAAAGCLVT